MMRSVESILAAVERIPAVTVEIDDTESSAGVRVGPRLVAHIDLHHGRVLVDVPADWIPTLHRHFPSSRGTANGIVFDLVESQDRSEALAAISRRANVERLLPQSRAASP